MNGATSLLLDALEPGKVLVDKRVLAGAGERVGGEGVVLLGVLEVVDVAGEVAAGEAEVAVGAKLGEDDLREGGNVRQAILSAVFVLQLRHSLLFEVLAD